MSSSREDILKLLNELLKDINEDWEDQEAHLETRLIDLGLESISLVYLIAELQQIYGLGDQLFRKMRSEGSLLKDMTVGSIVDSLSKLLVSADTNTRTK